MEKSKILVVEDNVSINDILTFALVEEGFEVMSEHRGKEALERVEIFNPDVILLDIMLPDITGYEICKKLNRKYPIIIISAKNDITDKLVGLDLGADDYISKPFDIREVIGRVRALLRRTQNSYYKDIHENPYININKNIIVNELSREVRVKDCEVKLKPKEYELLMFFNRNKNIVFTREELLNKVWGYDFEGEERTVDVHVRRLRSKIDIESKESSIETVFGVGYVMRKRI